MIESPGHSIVGNVLPPLDSLPPVDSLPKWLRDDLRSDHAGETGAVWIYHGILAVSECSEVREFASHHLAKEQEHLALFENWLDPSHKSLLISLWRLSGWLLGACAAMGGTQRVYITIDAVESFVVEHYREQILKLEQIGRWQDIRGVLQQFQDDEAGHQHDAAQRIATSKGWWSERWSKLVDTGSRGAVWVARKL